MGSCGAGATGRGGMNTSVCSVSGAYDTASLPVCDNLAPTPEHLFALSSCDILRNGEDGAPGIGEPVCAFRQNNCIWEVACGSNPLLRFSGELAPGATKAEWRLFTGTPCEASFDASGRLTGSCTVPGEEACQLTSRTPAPGGANCPSLPAGTNFRSRGCGGGDPLDCRVALQHECNFMAICGFSSRFPDVMIAGEASFVESRSHLEFNGVGDYQCHVDQATTAEIESGDRAANEWYGQCVNSAGGMCRNNWTPENPNGYRGLQIFFE
jgi:hypothetical protein